MNRAKYLNILSYKLLLKMEIDFQNDLSKTMIKNDLSNELNEIYDRNIRLWGRNNQIKYLNKYLKKTN